MLMGQLSVLPPDAPIPEMTSYEQIDQAMKLSCQSVQQSGPFKELNMGLLIDLQRDSLGNFEQRRQKFAEQKCAEQLARYNGASVPDSSSSDSSGGVSDGNFNPGAYGVKQRNVQSGDIAISTTTPNAGGFKCDLAAVNKAFAEEFGGAEALEKQLKLFPDYSWSDIIQTWDAYCVPGSVVAAPSALDYHEVAQVFNTIVRESNAVDLSKFDNFRTARGAKLLDDKGELIGDFITRGEVIEYVPSHEIPQVVKDAFVAAEDKNFYTHQGIEPQGILRGFFKYMQDGSVQGGSTITQQLVKNLVVGNEISLERKAREMILARRLENRLKNKDKILTAYLNIINLGRGANGLAEATKKYFGPDAKVSNLDINQATFFAGITHGPNLYNPALVPAETIKARQQYVLNQMVRAGKLTSSDAATVLATPLNFVPLVFPRTSYFQSAASREYLRNTPEDAQPPEFIQTSQHTELQRNLDYLNQNRLAEFEMKRNKVIWKGPLRNVSYLWDSKTDGTARRLLDDPNIWFNELIKTRSLYQGVFWDVAVILTTGDTFRIGVIVDGKPAISSLRFNDMGTKWYYNIIGKLKKGDMVFAAKKDGGYYFRVPPTVQSSTIVMDVYTGEVKAISGGFDFSTTPFNRAIDGFRQPGSTAKPFTYMAAFEMGVPPDYNYPAGPVTLNGFSGCNTWNPKNYSANSPASMPVANGLISSNNRLTAHLMFGIARNPRNSLNYVYNLMTDFGMYSQNSSGRICYPIILGAKEASALRMATAYGAIANGGWVVNPTFLKRPAGAPVKARAISYASQRSILEISKILAQIPNDGGTASAAKRHYGRIGGKTGTSQGARDVWFVAYSNQHVVASWMGYDQKKLKLEDGRTVRLSLSGGTGGGLVAPFVADVFDLLLGLDKSDGSGKLDDGFGLINDPYDYNYYNRFENTASSRPMTEGQYFLPRPSVAGNIEQTLLPSLIEEPVYDIDLEGEPQGTDFFRVENLDESKNQTILKMRDKRKKMLGN